MEPFRPPLESQPEAASRRATPRVEGPFEGRRCGALNVPVRIHDLSVGGCLIESHYEVAIGLRISLEIELPHEGCIAVQAETVHVHEHYGFAVEFVDMDEDVRRRLVRGVDRLLRSRPG